jgi:2-polyprenyl-6-methoxyphenol hydroxylase-like FAD-dependent oxidoreductase
VVVDGAPIAASLLPVGDAAVTTNPLYGRGTSLALAHGFAVADAITASSDPVERSLAVDRITREQLDPWYRASVAQDQIDNVPPGFLAAVRSDADVWRLFVRTFNLLAPPDALLADPHAQTKILEAMAAGGDDEPQLEGAPDRDEVLAIIRKEVVHA